MAKLSARGRYMVVEAVREKTADELQARLDRRKERDKVRADNPNDPSITPEQWERIYSGIGGISSTIWERETIRLMSDGKVLEKWDVRFRPDAQPYPGEETGRYHSYGWKVKGKAKVDAATFERIYRDGTEEMQARGKASSWTVTYPVKP